MNQSFAFYFLIILSCILLIGCDGDDSPQSGDPLDFPEFCSNYIVDITSSTVSNSLFTPHFVTPDAPNGSENFFIKPAVLDSNFNETNEVLKSINYRFLDGNGNVIKESSTIPPSNNGIFDIWDVRINSDLYYGEFSFMVECIYDSGSIIGEGNAFSVSCALIEKCCSENDPDCAMFLDGDNCFWGSNVRFQNFPAQSNFAIECCE